MTRREDANSVIIVAGGAGRRFGGKIPKQFLPIQGKDSALKISVEKFQQSGLYPEIIVVLPSEYLRKINISGSNIKITVGGKTRAESVINGLKMLNPKTKLVAIHDAVRPLVSKASIRKATFLARKYGAAVVGKIASDTVKCINPDRRQIKQTLNRKNIFLAQTPQVFSRKIILAAYQRLNPKLYPLITDDSQAVEIAFPEQRIIPVQNTAYNEKITAPPDLLLAKFWLKHNL